ncbi:MAG: transcriptional regulator [Cyanobacteria bacterium PR.3.49]|nr:transcriptional regulator [Cyanobacteria bacterium PR.3.49]
MNRRSDCPITCTLDLIGDKWTLVVLRDLLFLNKTKFEEFLASPEKISSSVLTDRLHKLERAGLIEKSPYSSHRLRMSYSPTERGKTLTPVLNEIVKWGRRNFEDTVSFSAENQPYDKE